jgi:glycosyltransferase involved in cell wall biosynthesis
MRVLLISPFSKPDVGGVESHLEKLISYLCKKKIKVTFVTYMPLMSIAKPAKYEKHEHLEVFRMPWFGKGWFRKLEAFFPLNLFYLFPGLFYKSMSIYLLRHREFDVIHAHGFIAGAIAKILKLIRHKHTVISTHAIYSLQKGTFKAKMFEWLLNDFDRVLAVGEPSLKEIVNIGIPAERVKVHPNWIDIESFRPETDVEARKVLGLGNKGFVVLFIGRMIGIKGELILLEVARRTKENIIFVFAGSGPEAHKVMAEAESNKKVVYLGKLTDEKIKLAYRAADIFVSPVLYDEGFATVYLEALSSGTPVLTARRGCLPYFLSEEVAELLDRVDADTVLEAIEKHYKNRKLLVNKRPECRTYAEKHFSENNAKIIFDSYSR